MTPHPPPKSGAAADRAAARFLDGDPPRRRRVADGSWLSRAELAPWHEWAAISAFLDAPHDRGGCSDQGCSAMRGGADGGDPFTEPGPLVDTVTIPPPNGRGVGGGVNVIPSRTPEESRGGIPPARPTGLGGGPATGAANDLDTAVPNGSPWTQAPPAPPDLPVGAAFDPAGGCASSGSYLAPPVWSLFGQTVPAVYTQVCFALEYSFAGWPAHACGAPCVVPQPCAVPTAAQANGALATLAADDPSDPALVVVNTYTSPIPGWTLLGRALTPNEVQALGGALYLLQSNIDLVEWAVCLACTWSPYILDDDVDTVVQAVVDGILGLDGRRIYLVNPFPGGASTGGASDLVTGVCCWMGIVGQDGAMQDGRTGVILPLGHPTVQSAVAAANNAAGNVSTCGQVCALLFLAETMLHELVHLCAETPILGGCVLNPGGLLVACATPGAANDALACWAVQNMSSISFLWAMSKRFTGLAGLACCPKTADTFFMTSEPDGQPQPDGTVGYNAFEPPPWLPGVPC